MKMRYSIPLMLITAYAVILTGFALLPVVAITILCFAVSLDFLTTYLCLRIGGREGNPAVAFLFRRIGVGKTFGLMIIFWVLIIVFRLIPEPAVTQTAIAFMYWWVPVNNVLVIRRLRRQKVVVS